MYNVTKVSIQGVAPLLMHNGQLSDPFNAFVREMKKISGKRMKTDADLMELSRLEWYGGLYLQDGKPCLPAEMVEAHLVAAAKKSKRGPAAKAGLFCDSNFLLQYDGPSTIDELWEDENFRLTIGVRISGSRIQRTRPIFHEWTATLEIQYNDTLLNEADILGFFNVGGEQIGLGTWRPKFGRYQVQK